MNSITNNTDIINVAITGVGGQGVLTLAEILAKGALADSHNVRVGEIHGMAQRGGHVICTVRIGDGAKGPIIDPGMAHLIIGFEPVETLREIHLIKDNGQVIMNSHVQFPVSVSMGQSDYPSLSEIKELIQKFTPNILEFDALDMALEAGSSLSMNIVMLGAIIASDAVPVKKETAIEVIRESFPGRYEEINIRAFELGYEEV